SQANISTSLPESLPASISGLIRYRLARLPPDVLEMLRTAAILGRTFAGSFLAEAMGKDEELLEEGLLTTVRAGVLRSALPETYTFSTADRCCLLSVKQRSLQGWNTRQCRRSRRPGSGLPKSLTWSPPYGLPTARAAPGHDWKRMRRPWLPLSKRSRSCTSIPVRSR